MRKLKAKRTRECSQAELSRNSSVVALKKATDEHLKMEKEATALASRLEEVNAERVGFRRQMEKHQEASEAAQQRLDSLKYELETMKEVVSASVQASMRSSRPNSAFGRPRPRSALSSSRGGRR